MSELNAEMHRARQLQSPEYRHVAAVGAALASALRKCGPDMAMRDAVPVIQAELAEFGL
ncbi:MAG TPA: hypothetical protein VFE59_12680 [Trebonia sp.]|nr:hypothetical protein [Trebonia sp.]